MVNILSDTCHFVSDHIQQLLLVQQVVGERNERNASERKAWRRPWAEGAWSLEFGFVASNFGDENWYDSWKRFGRETHHSYYIVIVLPGQHEITGSPSCKWFIFRALFVSLSDVCCFGWRCDSSRYGPENPPKYVTTSRHSDPSGFHPLYQPRCQEI